MRTTGRRTIRTIAAAAIAGLLLTACTSSNGAGDAQGAAPPSAASEEPTEEATRAAEDVTAAIFDSFEDAEPLGEAEGEMKTGGGMVPGRLTVGSAMANENSVQIRFTLSGTEAEEKSLSLDSLNKVAALARDIRSVTITDPATGTIYTPYLGYHEPGTLADAPICLCSAHPKTVDSDGVTLDATFPPVPDGTETITLNVPGFPDVEVPVTRTTPRQS